MRVRRCRSSSSAGRSFSSAILFINRHTNETMAKPTTTFDVWLVPAIGLQVIGPSQQWAGQQIVSACLSACLSHLRKQLLARALSQPENCQPARSNLGAGGPSCRQAQWRTAAAAAAATTSPKQRARPPYIQLVAKLSPWALKSQLSLPACLLLRNGHAK